MYESVHGRARRVLVVGASAGDTDFSPGGVLAPDGLLIVMESDAARAAEIRRSLSRDGLGERATVIGGDPRRMLYKLAGPFDVIICGPDYLSVRPTLEKLLAPDGVLITNGEP
jgi:predicted O-methyltransferase YrrM